MSTVLVIDDDTAIVDFVTQALVDEGHKVLSAVGGAALQLAADQQPDVILLDIMMPGLDGMVLAQHLRSDPRTAAIPIIAMSAQARLRTTRILVHPDDQLPKPFALDSLTSMVARWATASHVPATPQEQEESTQ